VKANVIGSVPAGEDPELFFGGLGFAVARSRLGCSLRDRNDFPGFAHVRHGRQMGAGAVQS